METILIATDGSPSADEAVRFGLALAHESGAHVTFVHVVDAPPEDAAIGAAGPLWHWPDPEDYEVLREARELASARGVAAKSLLLAGDTVDEIVACADSLDVDVILVGSRGFGAVRSALLGSVSHGVLQESRRPVLVVPEARVREGNPVTSTA